MKVKDIMHNLEKVPYSLNVAGASVIMDLKNVGELLVEKNGELAGILTESDILKKVVARCKDPTTTTAGDVLTTPVLMIDENKDIEDAAAMMLTNGIRRIVVQRHGKPVGIVTTRIISNNIKYLINKKLQQALAEKEKKK